MGEALTSEEALALYSFFSGLAATGFAVGSFGLGIKGKPYGSLGLGVGAALFSLGTIISDIVLGAVVLADEKIEPVKHVDPGAKIWLHRQGTIGMVSTKGEGDEPDGEKGTIVIGVNEQKKSKKENWQWYDAYYDFSDEDIGKTVKLGRAILLDKAYKKETKDQTRKDLGEIKTYRSIGKGSNVILKKKNIRLRAGDPEEDTTEDKRQIITIGEYENNKHGIQIHSGTSSITLKKNGDIEIKSDKNIGITSSSNIDITSQKNLGLRSKGGCVYAKGAIEHKHWKALA